MKEHVFSFYVEIEKRISDQKKEDEGKKNIRKNRVWVLSENSKDWNR